MKTHELKILPEYYNAVLTKKMNSLQNSLDD